ncbi:MAG: DsbA family protein [Thermomicrobiales bacterium]
MSLSHESRLTLPVGERDHMQGDSRASIVLVEYGDYECQHCAAALPIVESLQKTFGAHLCFVFRNFPLTASHPHAQLAAEAAEAAADQGSFWDMHRALFEHQQTLRPETISTIAGSLRLDIQRFEEALGLRSFEQKVSEDFMSGVRSGVNGTPTFFVNDRRYDGPIDAESLEALLWETLSGHAIP